MKKDKNNVLYLDKKTYRGNLPFKRKKKVIFIFLFSLLFIIAGYIILFSNRPEIIESSYGDVIDGFSTKAIIVRNEKTFNARDSGQLEFKQEAGKRIAYGAEVLKINGRNIYSQKPGIISFFSDGLEEHLNPEILDNLTSDNLEDIMQKKNSFSTGSHINKGDFLYRIIDNFQLYLVIQTSREEAERYFINEVVFVEDNNIDSHLIRGTIKKISPVVNGKALIVVSLHRFINKWFERREVEVEFIKNIHRGIVIPQSAVFNQPSGRGILVQNDSGQYNFKQINIEQRVGSTVVVSGIEAGERVVANPEVLDFQEN